MSDCCGVGWESESVGFGRLGVCRFMGDDRLLGAFGLADPALARDRLGFGGAAWEIGGEGEDVTLCMLGDGWDTTSFIGRVVLSSVMVESCERFCDCD